jgi:F0F1-type ATP synthase epsilon subunit
MPSDTLRLLVLTPDSQLLSKDNLRWVNATLIDGGIGIRPNHTPLLAETIDGPVSFSDGDEEQSIDIDAGILMVDKKGVIIFTTGLLASGKSKLDWEKDQMQFNRLAQNLSSQIDSP